MSQLEKLLSDWVLNDLITKEQAKKISHHEENKPSNSWVLYGFLILGALVIGIGIISLIAANWENIPDTVKLIIDFLLLIALATGSYISWKKKEHILFEVFLISFMVLCLASIGLISQIYHTGGKLYQALLMWSVITSAVAASSKRSLTPFIWAAGFFSSITFTALDSATFQPIFARHENSVLMAIPLLSALLAIICKKISGESGQTKSFRSWAIIGGMIALSAAETHLLRYRSMDLNIITFIPGYVFTILIVGGILISSEYKKVQKILLLLALAFYLIPFHLPMVPIQSKSVYAAFSIFTLSTMAIFLASLGLRGLFQIFLIILGMRFLVLYFQALGGLATTGFGLIISGVIIISMVITWNKYRLKITNWAEGLIE